jgi:hypothetical protein
VRARPEYADILVFATSGREMDPSTRALFDIVQPKPIDFAALVTSLTSALESKARKTPRFPD